MIQRWQIEEWIRAHRMLLIAIGIGLIVLLWFFFSNAIGGALDRWHASKFDKQQQAYEKRVTDLKTERDAAIKRADAAEANALLKEAEAKELHDLIDAKGGAIEKAASDLEKKIEIVKQNAGNCVGSPDPRTCVCQKLASAGFPCE